MLQIVLDEEEKEIIKSGWKEIEDHSCIRFIPRSKERNYLRVSKFAT